MTKTRSELRNIAMIILYQIDINRKQNIDYSVEEIIRENLDIDNEFVRDIVYGVITYESDIIKEANKYMKDWSIDRIDRTGAAILKMAIYELKYTDTPPIVVIGVFLQWICNSEKRFLRKKLLRWLKNTVMMM